MIPVVSPSTVTEADSDPEFADNIDDYHYKYRFQWVWCDDEDILSTKSTIEILIFEGLDSSEAISPTIG